MPTSEAPADVNEPREPADPNPKPDSPEQDISTPGGFLGLPLVPRRPLEPPVPASPSVRGSRWVDYDTHELLEMIGELEDERRWSRLREGFWLALLIHILFFSAITWIPTYIFKVPKVVDPFDVIKQRKDLAYLDLPPDALRQLRPSPCPGPCPTSRSSTSKRWTS